MSLIKLPKAEVQKLENVHFEARPNVLERWVPLAASKDESSVSIFEGIGEDWDGSGMTAKRMGGILRAQGGKDITVKINSYGGDFFEGVAIYNLLAEYPGKVTVQVLGLAASAASVIAMAGDEILIGDGSFIMIHNAWTLAIGNRNDLLNVVNDLQKFDAAMANLYASRTGQTVEAVAELMDAETFLSVDESLNLRFATGRTENFELRDSESKKALKIVESSLQIAGHSRASRRDILQSLFMDKPCAVQTGVQTPTTQADTGKPCAADIEKITLLKFLKGN